MAGGRGDEREWNPCWRAQCRGSRPSATRSSLGSPACAKLSKRIPKTSKTVGERTSQNLHEPTPWKMGLRVLGYVPSNRAPRLTPLRNLNCPIRSGST